MDFAPVFVTVARVLVLGIRWTNLMVACLLHSRALAGGPAEWLGFPECCENEFVEIDLSTLAVKLGDEFLISQQAKHRSSDERFCLRHHRVGVRVMLPSSVCHLGTETVALLGSLKRLSSSVTILRQEHRNALR